MIPLSRASAQVGRARHHGLIEQIPNIFAWGQLTFSCFALTDMNSTCIAVRLMSLQCNARCSMLEWSTADDVAPLIQPGVDVAPGTYEQRPSQLATRVFGSSCWLLYRVACQLLGKVIISQADARLGCCCQQNIAVPDGVTLIRSWRCGLTLCQTACGQRHTEGPSMMHCVSTSRPAVAERCLRSLVYILGAATDSQAAAQASAVHDAQRNLSEPP